MRQTQNTQKKDNRKSVFVIALLLLLVAVIGFGGYTLSKYVTKKSESGSASVAQWGYTIEADASGIFGTDYVYNTGKSASIVKTTESTALTVSAKDTDRTNRVAPGTTGSMTFTIGGTAEVLAQLNISMTNVKDVKLAYSYKEGTDVKTGSYTPVKWTLKQTVGENTTTHVNGGSLADIEEYFTDNAANVTVEPGKTAAINGTYTIEWVWAFETGTNVNDKALNNELDTLLGMVANAGDHTKAVTNGKYTEVIGADTNTTISFDLSISVVQLQK